MSHKQMTKLIWSKGKQNENGIWANPGWKRVAIKEEEVKYHKAKPTGLNEEEFVKTQTNELDIFQDIQNEIQIGTDKNRIDELPNSMRQLLYCSGEWHLSKSNKLYRIGDPITQAFEGQYGSYAEEADLESLMERSSTTRLFLEQSGIIQPEECTTHVSDILGSIDLAENGDHEVLSPGFGNRMDTDINLASSSADNIIHAEDLASDDGPDFSLELDEKEYSLKDPRMVNSALPSLPKHVMEKVKAITAEFRMYVAKIKDEAERTKLEIVYENAVDKEINPFLTCQLNSPFCGRGYSAPKKRYDRVYLPNSSGITEAADERKEFFTELFKEASDCSSYQELFGTDGKEDGFYAKIRNMNTADRELSNEWSILNKVDNNGKLTELSALNKARNEYICTWRKEKLGDEERLRIAVWAVFDREAGKIAEIRDNKGRIVQEGKKWKDSVWRQRRSKALQNLFLTVAQWDAVYKMLALVKNRIKLNKAYSEKRNATVEIIKKKFIEVQNLYDLNDYVQWAQKREFIYSDGQSGTRKMRDSSIIPVYAGKKWNTYKFKPSLLDDLSIIDEMLWYKACANKRKYLMQRLVIFRAISDAIIEVIETNIDEVSVSCFYSQCNAATIGKPKFAKVEDNKGYLFVECEDCGAKVWLINYKEEAIPKTLEECIRGLGEKDGKM